MACGLTQVAALILIAVVLANLAAVRQMRWPAVKSEPNHTQRISGHQRRWEQTGRASVVVHKEPLRAVSSLPGAISEKRPLTVVLNEAGKRQLAHAPVGGMLFLTFGSCSMTDFMHNWIAHVRVLAVDLYLLAALDPTTYLFCDTAGYPSATLPDSAKAATAASGKPGGGCAGYYRMEHERFLRMGVDKAVLLADFVRAGYDVLLSDLDVVWLNDPRSYLDPVTAPPRAALMALADVITASDAVDVDADSSRGAWLTRQEINTGVLLFRATKGAVAVIDEWRSRMTRAVETKQWVLRNDQLFFNDAVKQHGLRLVPETDSLSLLESCGREAAQRLFDQVPRADVRGLFNSSRPLAYHVTASEQSGQGASTEAVDHEDVHFLLSTFSITQFANGHTFFVQRLHESSGLLPYMVHTTHQFADTGAYPLGKRQRLRERGLWSVDGAPYYSEGNFLAVAGPVLRQEDIVSAGKIYPEHDPRRHIQIDGLQREVVRDALALARVLGRILIMPELMCWCDRYWNKLRECRYPTDRSLRLPFRCPMDHLYFLDKWDKAQFPFREHTFLNNSHTAASIKASRLQLHVRGDRDCAAQPQSVGDICVSKGTCFHEIADKLNGVAPAPRVVQINALDLRLLCPWMGSADIVNGFNVAMSSALHHTVRFCTEEPLRHAENGVGNCPWGYRPPTAIPNTVDTARAYPTSRQGVVVTTFSEPKSCRQRGGSLVYDCS